MSIHKQGNSCTNLKMFCKETAFIVWTNHQQRLSKTKQLKLVSEKLDKRGRGGSSKGWGEHHEQGGPALKDSEEYRSVQMQNGSEESKGIGEREALRMLQGMDHLGLVQAQHTERGICKQLQNLWLGFHLRPEELMHNAAHASTHEENLLWEISLIGGR